MNSFSKAEDYSAFFLNNPKYAILEEIGEGGFANVFKILDKQSNQEYALKLTYDRKQYYQEKKIYLSLLSHQNDQTNVPILIDSGEVSDINQVYYYLVIELFGSSLINILIQNFNQQPDMNVIKEVAIQTLKQIELLHSLGYYHRDIKVDNILFDKQYTILNLISQFKVYLIDFGFTVNIEKYHQSIKNKKSIQLVGNEHFMGLQYMKGHSYSYRDDIEAWFYSIIYFARGHLPWTLDPTNSVHTIQIMKEQNYQNSNICETLPSQFYEIFQYIKSMNSYPDYNFLQQKLKKSQGYPSAQAKCYVNVDIPKCSQGSFKLEVGSQFVQNSIISLQALLRQQSNQIRLEEEFNEEINCYDVNINQEKQVINQSDTKHIQNQNQIQGKIKSNRRLIIQKQIKHQQSFNYVNRKMIIQEIDDFNEFNSKIQININIAKIFNHNANNIQTINELVQI